MLSWVEKNDIDFIYFYNSLPIFLNFGEVFFYLYKYGLNVLKHYLR